MPAIVGGIVGAIISIGTTIYNIATSVYKYVILPVTYIKNTVEKVRGFVEGAINLIRGKLDYVLDIIGADVFLDLVNGVAVLTREAQNIMKGGKGAIVTVLGDLYSTIAGTASDIIHFVSLSLVPVTSRLKQVQEDIKDIMDFKIKDLYQGYAKLGEEIKNMNRALVNYIDREVKKEGETLKALIEGRFDEISTEITGLAYVSEDVAHFIEMLIKALEL